jgi:DNA mismatch repair protein MutH
MSKDYEYKNVDELLGHAKNLEGRRTSDICEFELPAYDAQKQKAFFGHQVEKYLGIEMNTRSEPDVANLGVELKVTGFKSTKQGAGFNAKERLVFGLIDYYDIAKCEHLAQLKIWHKIKRILLVVYLYEKTMDVEYTRVVLWEPTEEDIKEMQEDYKELRECVLAGEHISGKGFTALDNFPKHPGKYYSKYRKGGRVGEIPPSSEISKHPKLMDAEKRGVGLKNKFLTKIVARLIGADLITDGASYYISTNKFFT